MNIVRIRAAIQIGICLLFFVAAAGAQDDLLQRMRNLPFPAPAVRVPHFPDRTVELTGYGAVGDGQTLNTEAFARAIGACAGEGGGTVRVPRGLWLTGAIRLQSNVRLHLERGAVILFSRKFEDFPLIAGFDGTSRRYRCVPQLSAYRAENIAVTGEGMIDGQGEAWRPVKKEKLTAGEWKAVIGSGGAVTPDGKMWFPSREALEGEALLETLDAKRGNTREEFARAREFLRPVMVQFVDCRGILIDGPTFVNSPSFHVQPVQSENIVIRNATVRTEWWAQNGDGIDLSACREVLIYDCTLDVGDDALCIKPGTIGKRQSPGPACANIVITDCIVFHGHGGFVIGSESYGGARNIAVRNCTFQGTDVGLRFKSSRGRGGVVEKIFIDGITMSGIGREGILFDMLYDASPAIAPGANRRIPEFRDIQIRNVEGSGARTAISITGLEEMPVKGIVFEEITIAAERGLVCTDAEDLRFTNVRLLPGSGPVGVLNRSRNIAFEKCPVPAGADPVLRIEGPASTGIRLVGMDLGGKANPIVLGPGVGPDAVSLK